MPSLQALHIVTLYQLQDWLWSWEISRCWFMWPTYFCAWYWGRAYMSTLSMLGWRSILWAQKVCSTTSFITVWWKIHHLSSTRSYGRNQTLEWTDRCLWFHQSVKHEGNSVVCPCVHGNQASGSLSLRNCLISFLCLRLQSSDGLHICIGLVGSKFPETQSP